MTAHPEKMPFDQLLVGIESEVIRCMDLLMRIEEEVLPLVSHPIAPTLRAALQDIDLLSQCLDDIARSLKGAAAAEGAGFTLEVGTILAKIRLQDMRLRLEGGSYDARKLTNREDMFDAAPKPSAPEIHLF
jgi:hypothetical protein